MEWGYPTPKSRGKPLQKAMGRSPIAGHFKINFEIPITITTLATWN